MSAPVRRVLKGKTSRRKGSRPLADHGIPYTPVPGQLDLFEHSRILGQMCPCGGCS